MATTAALSHLHETVRPCHWLPHTATPSTIGSSSLTIIWTSCQLPGSCSWNNWPPDVKATQPHDPFASDVSVMDGSTLITLDIWNVPFQIGRKQPHHLMSDRNTAFSPTLWCSSLTTLDRSIVCLRNDLPCLITQQTCWSWPIINRNSLFEQLLKFSHLQISRRSLSNLGGGRHNVMGVYLDTQKYHLGARAFGFPWGHWYPECLTPSQCFM